MILLGGIPSESPLAFLAEALDRRGAEYRIFNQRKSVDCTIELGVGHEGADGELCMNGETFSLREFAGIYVRFMDDRLLPELDDEPDNSPLRRRTRALHDALYRWFEVADGRVVNRSDPQGSNGSKPYQAQLIARHGLRVPETSDH